MGNRGQNGECLYEQSRVLGLGDKPLGLGGKGLSSVGRRVSSKVLEGQRINPEQ